MCGWVGRGGEEEQLCLCEVEVETELSAIGEWLADPREKLLSKITKCFGHYFAFEEDKWSAVKSGIYLEIFPASFGRQTASLLCLRFGITFLWLPLAQKRGPRFVLIQELRWHNTSQLKKFSSPLKYINQMVVIIVQILFEVYWTGNLASWPSKGELGIICDLMDLAIYFVYVWALEQ